MQELSQAEPGGIMQPEAGCAFAHPDLGLVGFLWGEGVSVSCRLLEGTDLQICKGHVCAAVSASAPWLSGGIYSIFNNQGLLFPSWVTAASSALSVVSPDLLALFILISLALALSEAENPMSLLIRKWHPF